MSYLDCVVARNTTRWSTFSAAITGFVAMQKSWMIVHPSSRSGFTGSHAFMAFELVKVASLFVILSWVYVRNRNEDDRTVRSNREYAFSYGAALSIIIDSFISLSHLWQ